MGRIRLVIGTALLTVLMLAMTAVPAFATTSGGDSCSGNQTNNQQGLLIGGNTNLLGSQQTQQGNCNTQQDNDLVDLL